MSSSRPPIVEIASNADATYQVPNDAKYCSTSKDSLVSVLKPQAHEEHGHENPINLSNELLLRLDPMKLILLRDVRDLFVDPVHNLECLQDRA